MYGDRESPDSLSIRDRGGEQDQEVPRGLRGRACYSGVLTKAGADPFLTWRADELRTGSTE